MKRSILCILVVALAVSISTLSWAACKKPVVEIKPGMKVIAAVAGPNWGVARVESVKKNKIMVKDAGGGLGSLGRKEVAPHPSALYRGNNKPCFGAGDKVLAQAQGGTWRIATVDKVTGDKAKITFVMDKSKKNVKLSAIVPAPR
ncbi:MAG: hypothetical protein JXA24_00605 [Proteobacteria bacterium]|nr:hypothetical protein [Pseudomonadota bacterium]